MRITAINLPEIINQNRNKSYIIYSICCRRTVSHFFIPMAGNGIRIYYDSIRAISQRLYYTAIIFDNTFSASILFVQKNDQRIHILLSVIHRQVINKVSLYAVDQKIT